MGFSRYAYAEMSLGLEIMWMGWLNRKERRKEGIPTCRRRNLDFQPVLADEFSLIYS